MKLSLGSSNRILKGYKSVDLCENVDYRMPINDLSFFSESSIDEIYSSHSLEYFDFNEALDVLHEWYRVLKPGSPLRLSLPDFDKLLLVYQDTGFNIDRIIGPVFGRWKLNDSFIYHRCVYNRAKLSSLLTKVGFVSIADWDPFDFFNQIDPSYDDYSKAYYPHMDFDNGFPISLNLVCLKPQ